MLNTKAIAIQNTLANQVQEVNLRKELLSFALGVCVARATPLPSSPVDDLNTNYNSFTLSSIKERVFAFNEQIIVDTDSSIITAKEYWTIRYNSAYPKLDIPLMLSIGYDFYSVLVGVNTSVSEDTYKLVNENKMLVLDLINQINSMFND
jgi:hypothetical protein